MIDPTNTVLILLKNRFPARTLLQRGDLALSFRARDSVLDRDVFIKVLNPSLANDTEIRARFEREAKAVARLDHPNLVRIYEYGQDAEEGLFMLLEWVEGSNLAHFLKQKKQLTANELDVLARDLLNGAGALHSVGIVHRDLKPENVLLKTSENASFQYKITDFSLAALRDAPTLTHHEAIVGTPAYMSPEQAAGARVTEQTDLFALGVILYEAATGDNPFVSHSMLDTMRRIRESDISFSHAKFSALPLPLRRLISALLQKHPEQRPANANDALSLLDGAAPRVHALRQSSFKRNLLFAGLALCVILAGIYFIKQARILSADGNNVVAQKPDSSVVSIPPTRVADSSIVPVVVPKTDTEITEKSPPRDTIQKKITEKIPEIIPLEAEKVFIPDSVSLTVSTEPWAHVYFKNQRIATTPIEQPLRLPGGDVTLSFRNPAFPAIDLPFHFNQPSIRETIRLTDYVAQIKLSVEPWGECFVDGDLIGTTPLSKPLYLSPGKHSIRLTHPAFSALTREISAHERETINLKVDFTTGEFLANGLSTQK